MMTAPVGGIFYYDLKYGTTKGKVTSGQTLIKDFNRNYSSEHIDEEVIGVGAGTSFTSSLDFTPVKGGTIVVTATTVSGEVTATDDGAGALTGTGVASGTIDYDSGAISIVFDNTVVAATNVVAAYDYNMECNTNIPQVNIDIQLLEIRAQTRKLKALWCSEAADDLKAFHGIDAEAEVVAGIAAEIALELDREIIEDLRAGATGYTGTWSASVPANLNQVEHYRSIITEFSKASNRIHKNSLRGPANFMVTSPDVAAIIEQLETHGDFRPIYNGPNKDATAAVEGPHTFGVFKFGTLSNKWTAYKDPFFPAVNVGSGSGYGDVLMGYKGNSFIDAGYVWAPYVPLQVTATFLDPNDFQFRKGLRTRYARKLVRSEFYGRVRVTNM